MGALRKFENLTKDEILDNLEGEAIEIIEDTYLKPFTDEELGATKSLFADISREISFKKDEIKRLTDPLKESIKPLEQDAKEYLKQIKSGGVETRGRVFLIADYENRIVIKYDEEGRIVGTRPFSHKERQLTINSNIE